METPTAAFPGLCGRSPGVRLCYWTGPSVVWPGIWARVYPAQKPASRLRLYPPIGSMPMPSGRAGGLPFAFHLHGPRQWNQIPWIGWLRLVQWRNGAAAHTFQDPYLPPAPHALQSAQPPPPTSMPYVITQMKDHEP